MDPVVLTVAVGVTVRSLDVLLVNVPFIDCICIVIVLSFDRFGIKTGLIILGGDKGVYVLPLSVEYW